MSSTTTITESTAPWTATRCHRLLRPLLTHIAALRKDKQRKTLAGNGLSTAELQRLQQAQFTNSKPRKSVVLGKRPRGYPDSDDDYAEKKPLRKYGKRRPGRPKSSENIPATPYKSGRQTQRRHQAGRAPQEAEVVLPTPFLHRVRYHQPSSPVVSPDEPVDKDSELTQVSGNSRCHHSIYCGTQHGTRCAFEGVLAGLRRGMDAERYGLLEPVFKAMDALLKTTSPRKNQAAGPKSLLSMCLRKVPDYIQWEKQQTEQEDSARTPPKDCGLSFEIYSELETLGSARGWKHLCIVVRAHAVKIIQDAAAEGLFEDSVTSLMIRLCLEYMAVPDFTGLIEAFVTRQYPRPRSAHDDDMFTSPGLRPLGILKVVDPSGTSILPRVLADLFAEELLPSEWILTKGFSTFWPSIIGHITAMKPCRDTIRFIAETLTLLCAHAAPRRPRGVLQTQIRGKAQNTLVSAIGALGCVVLLSEEGIDSNATYSSSTRTATIKRRVEYVADACSAQLKRHKAKGRKLGTYLLALCSFLSLGCKVSSVILESSWKGVKSCKGDSNLMLQYDATLALMSSVAHFCGRGTSIQSNVHLSRLCDKLETLDLPKDALSSLRVDGAFRLAEHTGDLRDHAFAEELRAKAMACATPVQNSSGKGKKPAFSGLKWDDVISEWVTATPGSVVPAPKGTRRSLRAQCTVESTRSEADDSGMSETNQDDSVEVDSDAESAGFGSEDCGASSPNTQVSSEDEMTPEPFDDDEEEEEEEEEDEDCEFGETRLEGDSKPEVQTQAQKSTGLLLAARPRRLSRPITKGGDELAVDVVTTNVEHQEKWLSRKKPLRLVTSSSVAATTTAIAWSVPPAAAVAKKRVARASLMSLRSVSGSLDDESDDELSFL